MLIMAGVSSLVAANYYPWPEAVSTGERINTLLFEEFNKDFNMDEVRGIKVVRYDNVRNELDSIQLRRVADKWIMPGKGNFVVTNLKQITDVASSLTEKKIREEMSDKQEDHIKYGVVDPGNFASSIRSSLGTKIVLEGRQKKELGSLIIGAPVKSQAQVQQHFVRIPSQPHVYVIDFDSRILTTDVENWIDPNLLQLSGSPEQQPNSIEIDSYRVLPENIASETRDRIYRLRYALKGKQLGFDQLEIPNEDDEWIAAIPTQNQQQQLASWVKVINGLTVSDVRRKSKELIKALRQPVDEFQPEFNKELNQFGFDQKSDDADYEFRAAGGKFTVTTSGGVRMDVHIGNFVENAKTATGNSARYVLINAKVDDAQFPMPAKDADADEEDRAFLRAVDERDKKMKAARQVVRELNKTYANWFYMIDDKILEQLIPKVKLEMPTPSQEEPGAMLRVPNEDG